ncbi:MAG: hypothetical protein GC161_16410 [Planctomycetaceae bacterium]|nr:hypothetical protein [Planctomycetaceae bacterium]
MKKLLCCLALALGINILGAPMVTAQLSINGITLVEPPMNPTGATVDSQPGGELTARNMFGVTLIVQFKDDRGTVVGETSLPPGPSGPVMHGLPAGKYTICVAVAGENPDFEPVGCLDTFPPTPPGSLALRWRGEREMRWFPAPLERATVGHRWLETEGFLAATRAIA